MGETGPVRVRVVSFNVRNGLAFDGFHSWPCRRTAAHGAIADLDAEIVGLQEAYRFQLRWLLGRLGRYEAYGAGRGRGGGGERCPVLVDRRAFEVADHRTRWFGDTPDQPGSRLPGAYHPRIATMVRLRTRGIPSPVQVVNTHLDARDPGRRLQSVNQLVGWLDPDVPRIVLGDFNARPEDPLFVALAEAGLVSALPVDAPGTFQRFGGGDSGSRIDDILVSSHWEVESARVAIGVAGAPLPSDHWPVVADLRWRG